MQSETRKELCTKCGTLLIGAELAGGCPRCLVLSLFGGELGPEPVSSSRPILRRLGDYELIEEIARGGMGVVFRARQTSLGREVAVKVLRDAWLATPDQAKRFRAEAANTAKLNHPGIVAIHEVGEERGELFFAMDLVDGQNLAQMTGAGTLPPRPAAELVEKIADAVQHAHERGVLHRDLKPSNVLVDIEGLPHITDFGLARPLDEESSLTLTGEALGTPGYTSPEQAQGRRDVGPAADVYGLGAILFSLLTGRAPFVGASAAETLTRVLQEDPLSPLLLNPRVSPDLAAVCLKCLSKTPAKRYESARALAEDLRRFLRGEPTLARPADLAERLWLWTQRNARLATALAALFLVGAIGFAGILWQWRAAVSARKAAQRSASDAVREMHKAQLAQLGLTVGTRHPGHRIESLRLIGGLATNQPSAELRDLAVTAYASTDVEESQPWVQTPFEPSCLPAFDGSLGRVALGEESGAIKIYSFPRLELLSETKFAQVPPRFIQWLDRDDKILAVFDDGKTVLWDTTSGRSIFSAPGRSDAGRGQQRAMVDREEKYLAMAGPAKTLQLFDLRTGQLTSSARLESPVDSIAFDNAAGKIAVSFLDHFQVRAIPGLEVLSDDSHREYFANQMVWEPRDRWFFAAMQGWNVIRCQPGLGTEGQIFGYGHDAAVTHIARNRDGSLLCSYGFDNTSYIWRSLDPHPAVILPRIAALRFATDNDRMAAWQRSRGLCIFRVVPSKEFKTFSCRRPYTARMISFWPQGLLGAATSPAHVSLYDLTSGEDLANIILPEPSVACLTSDGTRLITTSQNGVQSWPVSSLINQFSGGTNLPTPTLIADLGTNFIPIGTLQQGSAPCLVAAGSARTVIVDLKTAQVTRELAPPAQSSFPVASPDGAWWIYSQRGPQGTWLYQPTNPPTRHLTSAGGYAALSPDNAHLLIAGTTRVECFNTTDWRLLWSMPVELASDKPVPCAFSNDGRWIGVPLHSNAADLLDAETGRRLVRFKPPVSALIFGISFDRDDTHLYASTIRGLFDWDVATIRGELRKQTLDWEQ